MASARERSIVQPAAPGAAKPGFARREPAGQDAEE
jgi:hypothetical protein